MIGYWNLEPLGKYCSSKFSMTRIPDIWFIFRCNIYLLLYFICLPEVCLVEKQWSHHLPPPHPPQWTFHCLPTVQICFLIKKYLRRVTYNRMFNTYFLCEDASWYGTTRRRSAAARSASHLLFAEYWNNINSWIIHPWKEQWTWQLGPWRSALTDKIDCNFSLVKIRLCDRQCRMQDVLSQWSWIFDNLFPRNTAAWEIIYRIKLTGRSSCEILFIFLILSCMISDLA